MGVDEGEHGGFPPIRYTTRLIDRLQGRKKREKPLPPPPPPPVEEPPHVPSTENNAPPVPRGALLPFWANYYPGIPEGPSLQEKEKSQRRERELAPIKEILQEANTLKAKVIELEETQVEVINRMAQELHDKEYRAPQRPIPCEDQRQACVDCYNANIKDPLKCGGVVKAFQKCSQKAHEEFIKSTLSQNS